MLSVGIRMVSVIKANHAPFNIAVCTCLKPVFSWFCCCISLACVFSLIDDWLQISKFGEKVVLFFAGVLFETQRILKRNWCPQKWKHFLCCYFYFHKSFAYFDDIMMGLTLAFPFLFWQKNTSSIYNLQTKNHLRCCRQKCKRRHHLTIYVTEAYLWKFIFKVEVLTEKLWTMFNQVQAGVAYLYTLKPSENLKGFLTLSEGKISNIVRMSVFRTL